MIKSWKNIKVCNDTRVLKPGDYYVPIKGEKFDGYAFIDEAMKKGAIGTIEEKELYALAKKKLKDLKPFVIGVTGSTGKTTTKEAIKTVISEKYNTLASSGNFNTALGLSINILNDLTEDHRVFVAEMGMDRFNEIKETCEVVQPNVSVLTAINETHLEKLGSLENIIKAKGEILEALDKKGVGILNLDDKNVVKLKETGIGKRVFYSSKQKADVWATDISTGLTGVSFTLNTVDKNSIEKQVEVKTKLLGYHSVSVALAAASAALTAGLNLVEIKEGFSKLKFPKGRLNILKGLNNSTLIDDTYNASPVSTIAALEVLKLMNGTRKIAILGDMFELGCFEVEGHNLVGEKLAELGVDLFVAVGKNMSSAIESYCARCNVLGIIPSFISYESASDCIANIIYKLNVKFGDIILIKGSQGMRMERVTEVLLCDKSSASQVLVRQTPNWKD